MTLDIVRVLEHMLWDRRGKLLILLTECVINGLYIDVSLQVGIPEHLNQVEVCGLLDGGQFAQGHQLISWYNRSSWQDCEMLTLIQDYRMVGSNAQHTPHAGVDLHHCTFIRSPGYGLYVGKNGLPRL